MKENKVVKKVNINGNAHKFNLKVIVQASEKLLL